MTQPPPSPAGELAITPAGLDELVRDRKLLVCLGPGGVGKTTTAAAVGVGAALSGRRTLVLTIDPAKRLAVAMGLGSISGEVRQVPDEWWNAARLSESAGTKPRLSAMMLDTKRACDHIVDKHARTEKIRRAILENPLYEQFSTALAGSHDYLAMERVYELRQEDEFDLIVLDTPPAAQAVEFLEAPRRLMAGMDTSGIDHLLQPLAAAGRSVGGRVMLGTAARLVSAGLSRFTGGQLLTDLAGFLLSFSSMFPGFQARARSVMELLGSDETAFLIVSAPTDFAAAEALRLRRTLSERGLPFGAFVVNRFHPAPYVPLNADDPLPPPEVLLHALEGALSEQEQALTELGTEGRRDLVGRLHATLTDELALAKRDERALRRLRASAEREGTPVALVPELAKDVHDLGGLTEVAGYLGVLPAGLVDESGAGSTY